MEPATWPPRPSLVKPLVILVVTALAWLSSELCRFGPSVSRADMAQRVVDKASRGWWPPPLPPDPWGNPYRVFRNLCGFNVVSAGEDGVFFTPDDIRSER